MIHIDRYKYPGNFLESSNVLNWRQEAKDFFEIKPEKRRQKNFRFHTPFRANPELREVLYKLFYGKCAYCESKLPALSIGNTFLTIDQFRPPTTPMGLSGISTLDGYWWLAYEWENLFPACENCNRAKGNKFPVQFKRVQPYAKGKELEKEGSLLLNPCVDYPETTLKFYSDGSVKGMDRKAETTIDVFSLNRNNLRKAREYSYEKLTHLINTLKASLGEYDDNKLSRLSPSQYKMYKDIVNFMQNDFEFAAFHRQHVPKLLNNAGILNYIDETERLYTTSLTRKKYFSGLEVKVSVWVDRVKIRNFRGIGDITIYFPKNTKSEKESWIFLLGDNGVGKSSILKAIGMCFLSKSQRIKLLGKPKENISAGAESASIEILSNLDDRAFEISFGRDDNDYKESGNLPNIPIVAYGPIRVLPKIEVNSRSRKSDLSRLKNLFDLGAPLQETEKLICSEEYFPEHIFNRVAISIKELLDLEYDSAIKRDKGKLCIVLYGQEHTMQRLSDGYQSVLAMFFDIIVNIVGRNQATEFAEGLVLIDELDAHLHPKWRLRIVEALRRTFPKLQFIVTTHDPLCLNGALKDEIYHLKHGIDGKVKSEILNLPEGARADTLLTGEWFELSTTLIDPIAKRLLSDYQNLLRQKEYDENEKEELEVKLRKTLFGPGETAIERLAWSAASQIISEQHMPLTAEDRRNIRKKIVNILKKK
jgi:uncharacterized protein (TIGR02646 family)